MVYIPGVRNHTSDTLSRHPSGIRQPACLELQDDHHSSAATCLPASPTPTSRVKDIPSTQTTTKMTASPQRYVPQSWTPLSPGRTDHLKPDTTSQQESGTTSPLSTTYHRSTALSAGIVIPAQLRQTFLHATHQGTSRMTARAQTSLFWPGISRDIAETGASAPYATAFQPAMPSTTPANPEYPFQHICADFFHHEGVSYLVLVDQYSNWPIVRHSGNGAHGLIAALREIFSHL